MKTVVSATHLIAAGVIAGAFAIGFLSGPALAEEQAQADEFQFKFQYEPSELTNSASAKKLLMRLERQVANECGADEGRKPLPERKLARACVDRTMSKAIEGFGSSTVAEAYKSRTGG
jgi:UrcA family protein